MKIIIVGYGEMFQSLISGVLQAKHEIVGVFRHENVIYSPFKRFIKDKLFASKDYKFIKVLNLYEIKAKSVNSKEFIQEINRLEPDIILVGSWSEKFGMQVINSPQKACINVHPSLLPKYRGPNPYMQVILHNEKESGITFHTMDVNYDTGNIIHQAKVGVFPTDTGYSLKLRCCDKAQTEVQKLLENFEEMFDNVKSQDEKNSTYFPQIDIKECILDFEKETAQEIDKRIRALTPWVKCVIPYENKFFEFGGYKVCTPAYNRQPAEIIRLKDNNISIVCADKRVIEFYKLKSKTFLSCFFTPYYLKKLIKINSKAI